MQFHLFGGVTTSGETLRRFAAHSLPDWQLQVYSRHFTGSKRCDFADPSGFRAAGVGIPALWISFGPIWLLAPFLEQLA